MFSKITKEQGKKIVKVAVYAGLSAGISALVALIASNPVLFGVLTPVVNILLVTLKQAITEEK